MILCFGSGPGGCFACVCALLGRRFIDLVGGAVSRRSFCLCKAATEYSLTSLLNRRASKYTCFSCENECYCKRFNDFSIVRVILMQVAMQPCEYNGNFFALLLGAPEF